MPFATVYDGQSNLLPQAQFIGRREEQIAMGLWNKWLEPRERGAQASILSVRAGASHTRTSHHVCLVSNIDNGSINSVQRKIL